MINITFVSYMNGFLILATQEFLKPFILSGWVSEIVKCGFWRKPQLFYHFCGAPTQWMKISNFPIYSFTNDLLR